jgi:hypothetical protein
MSLITGQLKSNTGNAEDLGEAMEQLTRSLDAGQTLEDVLSPIHAELLRARQERQQFAAHWPHDLLAGLAYTAESTAAVPTARQVAHAEGESGSAPRVALRGAGALAPEWTRNAAPSRTHGPFLNEAGEAFWIDVFDRVRLWKLSAAPSGLFGKPHPLVFFPAREHVHPDRGEIALSRGSVWFPAAFFVASRPDSEFVGLRIDGGTLSLSGAVNAADHDVSISGANWNARLALYLAPAQPVAGARDGVGADVAASEIHLPERVEIEFSARGITSLQIANFQTTAYGTRAEFRRAQDAAAFYDAISRSIVIPCETSLERFEFRQQRSTLISFRNAPRVQGAGFALPITQTSASQLVEAAGSGAAWLQLDETLEIKTQHVSKGFAADKTIAQLAPGFFSFYFQTTATHPIGEMLELWDEENVTPLRRSRIDFSAAQGSTVTYLVQPNSESVLFEGKSRARLDRPVAGDGRRLAVVMPKTWLQFSQTKLDETRAYVLGINTDAAQKPHVAIALENMLLKVRPPAFLLAFGKMDGGTGMESGRVYLSAALRSSLLTLPDPYAASFPTRSFSDQDSSWITSHVEWTHPANAKLSFINPSQNDAQQQPAEQIARATSISAGRELLAFYLLDVSTNADQLGVVVPLTGIASAKLENLTFSSEAKRVALFTLPPISWEPMLTAPPQTGSADPPLSPAPNDGGPALLQADSVELVPVEPKPLLREYNSAINVGQRHFAAQLPLPFGIIAHLRTQKSDEPQPDFITRHGKFSVLREKFPEDLITCRQISIGAPDSGIAGFDPVLPGKTSTVNTNQYAEGVLSQNIHTRWKGDFGPGGNGIPVRRYDLSGYGASLFSDWRNQIAAGPAIIQARFDVIIGRTAHEVIQMQSFLCPWMVKVVRTITIERTMGGWILREDSGWVAASDGKFEFPADTAHGINAAFPEQRIHRGAVLGVVNVRNILLRGAQFPVPPAPGPGPVIWQPVTFDADVLLANNIGVSTGGTANPDGTTRVPSRGIDGYIQIDGPKYNITENGQTIQLVAPATDAQLFNLLTRTGPAVAPIACTVETGPKGKQTLEMRASRGDVTSVIAGSGFQLVAALRGTPVLPRDGAWSVARMQQKDTAPNALDPQFALPLVRPNATTAGADRWHVADPADIVQLGPGGAPQLIYGFLQSTGTQKIFFARPQVTDTATSIQVPKPPKLGDVAALFNAAGIFPSLGDAFDFQNLKELLVSKGEPGFAEDFPIHKVGGKPRQSTLMDLGGSSGIQVIIRYADEHQKETIASVKVDPLASPRWRISLQRVCFGVMFKNQPLISIYAGMSASEGHAPGVSDLNIRYESFLDTLQAIFSNVQQVAKFLPGSKDAGLKVGFQNGALTVRNAFALPNLPLGTGQITDIALNMGFTLQLAPMSLAFTASLGSSQNPFHWVVSPLAGTGAVQVGVSNNGLDVLVQAGLGVGLAIDLGIAAGSASIALALELNTEPDPFELKIILSGRASVEVLRGLASATITLAAGIGIIPPPPSQLPQLPPPFPTQLGPFDIGLTASVAVGIHISICWVIDIDFDGYWQFRQNFHTPAVSVPI